QGGAVKALVQNVAACDEVWVVSEGAGQNLRSLGYEGDYRVMQNGVDVPRGCVSDEAVAEATAGYDLPRDVPMFLFVGRMMWYKGLRIILDALAALKETGAAFRMVFIGDGRDASEVRAYTTELGMDDRCVFTGAISDRETIRAWYTRADVFLFPSTYDTNGLVVREAAASATATVMVAGSCAAEGVTDGRNGFLIEENAASLCAKLSELCAEPEQMRRVGELAQSELYLSWEDAVARACERYEIVIDNYRSGKYPKHRKPLDEFLKSQGELMDALALIDEAGDGLRDNLRDGREELLARVREGGEKLRAGRDRINEQIDLIWSKMDRYL
ncbi:MAG: glycosyltransferase, partial [Kiritimatiellae bacterium]|nr:glycosyltransferase [Kiritimatiellia bacterium]